MEKRLIETWIGRILGMELQVFQDLKSFGIWEFVSFIGWFFPPSAGFLVNVDGVWLMMFKHWSSASFTKQASLCRRAAEEPTVRMTRKRNKEFSTKNSVHVSNRRVIFTSVELCEVNGETIKNKPSLQFVTKIAIYIFWKF